MTILETGQWRVRDLVMGPGTPYRVLANSNSFTLGIRAPHTQERPHAHGSLVGSEWANARTVPIRVMLDAPPYTESAWLDALDELTAAFAPVGDSGGMVELYRNVDGREFVWFGRTRMVEPETDLAAGGYGFVQCAFVAADPRRYSAAEASVSTGLAVQTGGLTVPVTAPVAVTGRLVGGRGQITNNGTASAPLTARIDGPVVEPGFVLYSPDGSIQSVRFSLTLLDGQWLEIDSVTHTAFLNGAETANRRPDATWLLDDYPIQPGLTRVRFVSGAYDEDAELTVTARSAWW